MFRLIEITRISDTESQAILDFESEVEASGELHSRLGAAMKAETYQAERFYLIISVRLLRAEATLRLMKLKKR